MASVMGHGFMDFMQRPYILNFLFVIISSLASYSAGGSHNWINSPDYWSYLCIFPIYMGAMQMDLWTKERRLLPKMFDLCHSNSLHRCWYVLLIIQ